MGATTVIRPASAADAPMLAELGTRTFRDTYAAETAPEDMTAYLADAYREDAIRAELADPAHRYLVAEADGSAAGFAHLQREAAPPGVDAANPVLLAHLYLDRAFQGRGLGSALMGRLLGEARADSHDAVWLGVWERNPRAIACYERWGFAPVGEIGFVFGADRHRDIVMARSL